MGEVSVSSMISESLQGTTGDIAGQIGLIWELIKALLIVPLLKVAVYICLAMELTLFMERFYMGSVIILVKLFWKKPNKRYNWEPIRVELEIVNFAYPLVLVQIPMFNEREVCICFVDGYLWKRFTSSPLEQQKCNYVCERKNQQAK